MTSAIKSVAFGVAITLGLAAAGGVTAKPAPKPAPRSAAHNWGNTIAYLPSGAFVRGNPAAKVKLVEYISYTCPHCADFNAEAAPTMSATYIATGKVQVEVRPFFRNMFDVTASLLAHCGPADRFRGNHDALLAEQKQWLAGAANPSDDQIKRWSDPDFAKRMQAVATDLGLNRIMLARGYSAEQLGTCLADKALAQKLADLTQQGVTIHKVEGTPSFLINNVLQSGVFTWPGLHAKIDQAVR
ncbi:MAG: hypothetical protein RLZZ427_668 [Pseudomonadota bacterium]|jgi:protein-disulfide isomerase